MVWRLDRQQKNTLANKEKKMSRERGKGSYKTPPHPTTWIKKQLLLLLQLWLMWKEVQENYSLVKKEVTFHSSSSSSIHTSLHPCSDTCRCFWSVCSGGIPAHILAHHPPLYEWSFVSIWTQLAEVSFSYSRLCLTQKQNLLLRGCLQITVFCVMPLSVTIQ